MGTGSRAWRLIAGAFACTLALTMVGEAHPFHEGSGCGRWNGRWRRSHSCTFPFHGFPVSTYGNATSTRTANVRVWVTAATPAGEVTVVECSGSDSRWVTCDNTQPQMSYLADVQSDEVQLTCHVQGLKRGQYWCASGGGVPIPP